MVSVADFRGGKLLANSVVAGCLWVGGHGVIHLATLLNETTAVWKVQLDQPCQAIDSPNPSPSPGPSTA